MTRLIDRRKLTSSVSNATHATHPAMGVVCAECRQTGVTALNAILLGKKSDHLRIDILNGTALIRGYYGIRINERQNTQPDNPGIC